MLEKILLYIRTINHLHIHQVFFRIWFLIKNSNYKIKNYDFKIRKLDPKNKIIFLKKKNSIIEINKFNFINQEFKIDTYWNIKSNNKLWEYNLHYFDYLNSNFKDTIYLNSLINSWIDIEYTKKKVGLDPYPSSLRIVNWIKYFISRDIKKLKFDKSLFNQIIYLSENLEFHLLGNHLIANLKALIFGCLYFDTPKTNKILSKSLIKLEKQLKVQILSDGGHAEFSPMYHAIVMEDILDILSIIKFYQFKISDKLKIIINKKLNLMLKWLNFLSHPNETFCKFNDTTQYIAQPYSSLKAYSKKIGLKSKENISDYTYLKETGYFIANIQKIFFIMNVGKSSIGHLSGHTHADTFSFELSYGNTIFFTNGGISTYEIGETRDFERSSANHNTIFVNNRSSSEIWKSFRLARRPKIGKLKIIKKNNLIKISNYYVDYLKEYRHTRSVTIDKKKISIFDNNENSNSFFSRMIIRPDIKIKKVNKNTIILSKHNRKIKIIAQIGKLNLKSFNFKDQFASFKSTFSIDIQCLNNKSKSELIFL